MNSLVEEADNKINLDTIFSDSTGFARIEITGISMICSNLYN
jgi:hypothetical protein